KVIAYQHEFHALRERLRVAEQRTLQRSSELNAILEQQGASFCPFSEPHPPCVANGALSIPGERVVLRLAAVNGRDNPAVGHYRLSRCPSHDCGSFGGSGQLGPDTTGSAPLDGSRYDTQKLLKELTHRKPLQVPNIYYHLPHLLNKEESLQPAVQVGQGRTKVSGPNSNDAAVTGIRDGVKAVRCPLTAIDLIATERAHNEPSLALIPSFSVVMGIPTVKRKVKSYLAETLRSLIDKLSSEEKLDCVIVVYVGEVGVSLRGISSRSSVTVKGKQTDTDYVNSVVEGLDKHNLSSFISIAFLEAVKRAACAAFLSRDSWCWVIVMTCYEVIFLAHAFLLFLILLFLCRFAAEFSSGLLELISPPASYYPDLNNLKETFGDSKERVKWRTKQNLDFSFLMMYAANKGTYYVQLEDDIVAKPNYFATMKNFALQLASEDWMILEFSQLGFIGSSAISEASEISKAVRMLNQAGELKSSLNEAAEELSKLQARSSQRSVGRGLLFRLVTPCACRTPTREGFHLLFKRRRSQGRTSQPTQGYALLPPASVQESAGFGCRKMFQAPDLNLIVEFIFMFYKEKPIDWLLDHILWVKVCNPEKDAVCIHRVCVCMGMCVAVCVCMCVCKHCERQKSGLRVRFRPSLFQHVGLHSSLAGKIQKLTDKDFLKPLLHKMHVNPPAEVTTTLKVYQGHTLEKTYMGEDYFWAITPTAGDTILFKFDRPVSIERYLFRSGNQEHPGDKIENATVEILPQTDVGRQTKEKYRRTADKFYRIGQFEKGVAEAAVDPIFNPVVALRLTVVQDSSVWAILSEVRPPVQSHDYCQCYCPIKSLLICKSPPRPCRFASSECEYYCKEKRRGQSIKSVRRSRDSRRAKTVDVWTGGTPQALRRPI
ncbi:hypothetical protein JZ751_028986, partial [Albula glossodonta]